MANRVLVGGHVIVPESPLFDVADRELPVLLRILEPLEEALLLLLLRYVEEELADDDSVTSQIFLEVANVLVALLPNVLGDQLGGELLPRQQLVVNADDERLLIVAAVEDADAPALRQRLHRAPQEVMIELFVGRRLERVDLTALRVDAGQDVLDRAVLARRIHGLKDEQHRPAVLGVEHVLQLGERLDARGERFLGARLVLGAESQRLAGIDAVEAEPGAIGDAEGLGERSRALDDLLDLHASPSLRGDTSDIQFPSSL